jgi:twitching motility protein PilT
MLQLINRDRTKHTVTIERLDKISARDEKCIIGQRQVGTDRASFSRALRRILKQGSNIIYT